MVLSIPFALSQTRKAIPAGRYEALSGVKISHTTKGADSSQAKDSVSLFLAEVAKNLPQGRNENSFYSSSAADANFKAFLVSKGVVEAKTLDSRVNILLSDDLNRDDALFKKIKSRGSLIVLKDKHALKDVMTSLAQFEVVLYQADADQNYYLLKLK